MYSERMKTDLLTFCTPEAIVPACSAFAACDRLAGLAYATKEAVKYAIAHLLVRGFVTLSR